MTYRATMRQGLALLALLGAALGVETFLVPTLPWARGAFQTVHLVLASLLVFVLCASLVQRVWMIRTQINGKPSLWRLLRTSTHGPFFLLHAGLVLLVAALLYTKHYAMEAVIELPVGGEGRTAVMDDGRRVTLPFTVRANAFDTEHYSSGEVKQFVGGVALADGDEIVAAQQLGVGAPLDYRGYRFSLFRFGYRGSRVTGSVRPISDPSRATGYDAAVGTGVALAEHSDIVLTDLVEHATRRTPDGDRDVGRAVLYEVSGRDNVRYEVLSFESASHVIDYRPAGAREFSSIHLLQDREHALALPFDQYLTVASIQPVKAIGLQIRYYPGLWFLLSSAALVVVGVAWMMRFWQPPAVDPSVSCTLSRVRERGGVDTVRLCRGDPCDRPDSGEYKIRPYNVGTMEP